MYLGVGVRVSLYIQAFCVLFISACTSVQMHMVPKDLINRIKMTPRVQELKGHKRLQAAYVLYSRLRKDTAAEQGGALLMTAGGMLIYGCALIISTAVQAATYGLNPYHGFLAILSTWITAFCALPAQASLGAHKSPGSLRFMFNLTESNSTAAGSTLR